MARQPKLRKKNGYWMTKAGGTEIYFDKVSRLPYADARRLFLDHLKTVSSSKPQRRAAVTAEMLCDLHLDWLQDNRSRDLYKQRQYLLSKWCDFAVGKGRERTLVGELAAARVSADHLLAWKQNLYGEELGDVTVQHALAAVKSCWYWGIRHKHLPADCQPFTTVEKIKTPPKAVSEEDLMTPQEREALFRWADADLGRIRDAKTGKYPEACLGPPCWGPRQFLRFDSGSITQCLEPRLEVRVEHRQVGRGDIVQKPRALERIDLEQSSVQCSGLFAVPHSR